MNIYSPIRKREMIHANFKKGFFVQANHRVGITLCKGNWE